MGRGEDWFSGAGDVGGAGSVGLSTVRIRMYIYIRTYTATYTYVYCNSFTKYVYCNSYTYTGEQVLEKMEGLVGMSGLHGEVSLTPLPALFKWENTDPFAAWFVVTGKVKPDGIRSVLGAISSLPIVAFRE